MATNRRLHALATLIAMAVSLLATAAVSAPAGHGAPIPQPVSTPPPLPTPLDLGPGIRLEFLGFPFDFHFDAPVYGFGFKPGERVTIAVQNVSAAPVTAVADSSGSFVAQMDFTWVFCGPHATRQTAPAFVATGSQGSTFRMILPPAQCPMLVSQQTLASSEPAGSGGSAGSSSGIVPGGTAITGPPIVVTAQPVTPGVLPPRPSPVPIPTAPPQRETFQIQGFGFVPGEQVTVREVLSTLASPPTVQTEADSQGRLNLAMQAYVPGHCSYASLPRLVATGDEGTAVTAPLDWRDPIMSPCMAPPGAVPPVGTPPPPGVPIPAATPPPPAVAAGNGAGVLSVSLHPSVGHPGGMERAIIQAAGSRTVRLTVQYPGNGNTIRTPKVGADGQAMVRWRIPSSARLGVAHGNLIAEPGNVSLQIAFKLR